MPRHEKNIDRVDLNQLPPLAREMADIAGLDAVLKLARAFGGTRLYIPSTLQGGQDLIEVIGSAAMKKISARFGGECIDMPKCQMALTQLRNAEIVSDRSKMTDNQLAR